MEHATSLLEYQPVPLVAGFITLALAVPLFLVLYSKKRERENNELSRLMNL
jgi:hypothetical protein